MDDSVKLEAEYYVPAGTVPAGGFPTIIFIHGFAMSEAETDGSAHIYSEMGYFTFTYSVRGHGGSGGLSTIMSTRERQDLAAIVNFVRALPGVNPSRVGISGGSQGGLHGLWAAADKLPVVAITSDVIGPTWASDMLANGCYRSTLMYLVSASTVRFAPIRDSLYNLLLVDDYDNFTTEFVTNRDIDPREYASSRTPLMLFGKWQDHYFRSNIGITAYQTYRAHKDAQKLYLGTGGHYSDDVQAQWTYQFSWITSWFSQFLQGNQTGILNQPDITYGYSSLPMDTNGYFTWNLRQLTTWPPSSVPINFYLQSNGGLSFSPPTVASAERVLLNDYRDSSYTFYWAFWDDFQGDWFDSSFHQQSLVFQTTPLLNAVDWIGIPTMHLYVASDRDKFPVNVQVYEVDPQGNKYFVNRINYEGRKNVPGQLHAIDADGNAHAHEFKAGNSIRIEITNLDMTNRKLLGWYPFVVPVFERSNTHILMDANHPSYISLPILSSTLPQLTGAEEGGGPGVPRTYGLEQNYPNPFNPTTSIEFHLAAAGLTKLTVYDILGREVARLVDKELPAGSFRASWDAAAQPSGVYFYRLESGSFSETKRLLLLR
jgi:predicted acyl esterase